MTIIEKIDSSFADFTKGQKKIASYIMSNKHEVLYLTAADLGDKVGLSESSVIRFANHMGHTGYKAFLADLRETLLGSLDIMSLYNETMEERAKNTSKVSHIIQDDLANINNTFKNIEESVLYTIAERIKDARNVGIVAMRGTIAPAHVLTLFTNQLFGKSHLLTPGMGDAYETISHWDERDLIIAFELHTKKTYTHTVLEYARENGCFVVGITCPISKPTIDLSDLFVFVETHSAYVSYTASIVLVNILLDILNQIVDEDELFQSFRSTERILSKIRIE